MSLSTCDVTHRGRCTLHHSEDKQKKDNEKGGGGGGSQGAYTAAATAATISAAHSAIDAARCPDVAAALPGLATHVKLALRVRLLAHAAQRVSSSGRHWAQFGTPQVPGTMQPPFESRT